MEEKTHGGKREGAGRKAKTDKKKVASFSIDPVWLTHLEMFCERNNISKSEAVEQAIVELLYTDEFLAKYGRASRKDLDWK